MEKAKNVVMERTRAEKKPEDDLEKEPACRRISLSEAEAENTAEPKARGFQIPTDFRCPLSLELMCDPVIVASGQTYERSYIQRWLDQGNTTCPKTRQTLTHTNLIPNYTVKALIANWCEANEVPLHETSHTDTLSYSLLPLKPVEDKSEEFREVCVPRIVQYETVLIQQQQHERSMSGIGSRPNSKSRRALQTSSIDDGGLTENGFQHGAAESGEASQSVFCGLDLYHVDDADMSGLGIFLMNEKLDACDGTREPSYFCQHHHRTGLGSHEILTVEEGQGFSTTQRDNTMADVKSFPSPPHEINVVAEMEILSRDPPVDEAMGAPSLPQDNMVTTLWRRRDEDKEICSPRIVSNPIEDTMGVDGNTQQMVDKFVLGLGCDDIDMQRHSAAKLRLLAKYNMENRIIIANSGAIKPLVSLLKSTDPKIQENSVTALLNLSINDNNKTEIAAAGAIDPLVNVLKVGNAQAMENAAATLFSLSVMDDNKVSIGASGAIPPLVHLLVNGTPRGKKDAATALFNLSIFHENKVRIVRAGAIKPLVELMADPAAGMVDKAVAVLANLATIPEGRVAIGDEGGIPALVEVVEAGSQRGKENAAAALLQLCMNSHKHRALVLQEGAIPPLVALSQSGTARAKEKASALLRHFREQRHQVLGPRPGIDRQMMGQY